MAESKGTGDRRAQHVALFGLVLQVAAFVLVVVIALLSGSSLLAALMRCMLVGIPIWFVLYLVLNQVRRVQVEALETEELRRAREAGASQALFEMDEEALLLEQNRLRWMVKWLLPSGAVVVALALLLGNFAFWGWSYDSSFTPDSMQPTGNSVLMMWLVVGVGFLGFLYARYALAVAKLPQWGLIRAGAVCMAGSALACVLVAAALMGARTFEWAEPAAALVMRVALLVLGIEFAGNFILDLYRPRVPGEVPRPSFDSRLLGMIGEPGGFAKSIADAFNYQFGFDVSSTWFYQLLQRWLFPITMAAAAVVLLLTSVVIVGAHEAAVVERFGREPTQVLTPGIHFKLPFPIDIVHRAPVKEIRELVIGEGGDDGDDEEGHSHGHEDEAVIWTEAHEFVAEFMMLVAAPKRDRAPATGEDTADKSESVPVSLLMVSVPIEYRISDVRRFQYVYEDVEKLLEVVAYRYLSDYASSVDVDDLMGPRRGEFNANFADELQLRLDDLGAGIEICLAGIRDAHPPAQDGVAAAYQSVIEAEISKSTTIHAAEAAALKMLIAAAGTEVRAKALDEAIRARDAVPENDSAHAALTQRVESLLMGNATEGISSISGGAAAMIADARTRASLMTSGAMAKAQAFGTQVAAYEAAPELYSKRKLLEAYAGLADVRKYLIVGDRSDLVIEYETTKEAGLDEVLSQGVEKERNKR